MSEVAIPPAPLKTAVLFLVFNRPDTTKQVFEAIRQAKPPRLYVAADGPRVNRAGEAECALKVRQIATAVDWPCEVKTLFRSENLGCKKAVSGGIDWFFENEEQGIILEDDCLPDPTFFRFCEEMLFSYRNDDRILMISGTNLALDIAIPEKYYFSRYPHIWGWASWRRAWCNYDVDMVDLPFLIKSKSFIDSFPNKSEYFYWVKMFTNVANGKVDTWDVQVMFLSFVANQLTIYPSGNLISNIGFGENSTHTKDINSQLANLPFRGIDFNLPRPIFMLRNLEAENIRKAKESIAKSWFIMRIKYLAKIFFSGI